MFGADGYICGEIYEADESCIHKLDLFIKATTRNLYMSKLMLESRKHLYIIWKKMIVLTL